MQNYSFTDHAGDSVTMEPTGCDEEPCRGDSMQLVFRRSGAYTGSVHLPPAEQARLVNHLADRVSSRLQEPVVTLEQAWAETDGYLLTISGDAGQELSVSDSRSLSSTEMSTVIDAAGRVMERIMSADSQDDLRTDLRHEQERHAATAEALGQTQALADHYWAALTVAAQALRKFAASVRTEPVTRQSAGAALDAMNVALGEYELPA
jgi:hypothetical protein